MCNLKKKSFLTYNTSIQFVVQNSITNSIENLSSFYILV